MQVNIEKLETIANFSKRKGLSRMHVYRLAEEDELTLVKIDGVAFIFLDEKAEDFKRKRKLKEKK